MYTVPSSYATIFFFNDTATTEIYTLSLHDALPISLLVNVADRPLLGRHQLLDRLEQRVVAGREHLAQDIARLPVADVDAPHVREHAALEADVCVVVVGVVDALQKRRPRLVHGGARGGGAPAPELLPVALLLAGLHQSGSVLVVGLEEGGDVVPGVARVA